MDLLILLIKEYTFPTLVIGIVFGILVFKEIIKFVKWFKETIIVPRQEQALERQKYEDRLKKDEALIATLIEKNDDQDTKIKNLIDSVQLLIDSDKDAIKAWITKTHHELMRQGWVDDYTLQCIEARYTHYRKEKGNSFVEDLMTEIRALPHLPPAR